MGRALIGLGLLLVVVGVLVLLAGRMGFPLGRLPGDVAYRGKHFGIYIPIVSCLVISVLLSLVMWLVNAGRR